MLQCRPKGVGNLDWSSGRDLGNSLLRLGLATSVNISRDSRAIPVHQALNLESGDTEGVEGRGDGGEV